MRKDVDKRDVILGHELILESEVSQSAELQTLVLVLLSDDLMMSCSANAVVCNPLSAPTPFSSYETAAPWERCRNNFPVGSCFGSSDSATAAGGNCSGHIDYLGRYETGRPVAYHASRKPY